MKKVLLGSTAVIGAAMMFAAPASAEWETTIGGFLKAEGWVGDQDLDDDIFNSSGSSVAKPRGYSFGNDDFELQIKARNTSDNGLTYGVTLELENDFNSDEAYVYIGSDWGQITLGAQDGATDAMPYSGDFSLVATGGYDGGLGAAYNYIGSVVAPDLAADTGDSAKIIYRSPRFSGFQVQVNYAPDGSQGNSGDAERAPDGSDDDVFQIGANWVESINGIDIGIGGAYSTSSPDADGDPGQDDTEGAHIGFNIGFSGFTVGASYGDNFDSGCDTADGGGCEGGVFYELAGGYSTGPFSIGIGYFNGERDRGAGEAGGAGTDETEIFSITGQYSLAPGLAIYSEVNFIDEDGVAFLTAGPNDPGTATDNDGTVFMLGVSASF
jgi:predicted porin